MNKKTFWFFTVAFLLAGVCSLAAQDMIILKDGNIIEAKVLEIHPAEIRYKNYNHLDGPTVVIPAVRVLSIKYENGTTQIIDAATGEENTSASNKVNTNSQSVSVEFYGFFDIFDGPGYPYIGFGTHYEQRLNSNFSIGTSVYYGFFFGKNSIDHFGADGFFRFYPLGNTFFFGSAMGFGFTGDAYGFAVTPEIGWKINVGNAGGWFIEPNISMRYLAGYNQVMLKWYLGVGYAF